jgi:hypothetical protein
MTYQPSNSPAPNFGASDGIPFQFDSNARNVFQALGDHVGFVSACGIVLGILGMLSGLQLVSNNGFKGLPTLVATVGFFVQGIVLRSVQRNFKAVAQATGDDMHLTMEGLSALGPYYTVLLVTAAVQLVCTLIGMVM